MSKWRDCPACGRRIQVRKNDRLFKHYATVSGEVVMGQVCPADDVLSPVPTIAFPGSPGVVHLPVVHQRVVTGVHPTVVMTLCGRTGIAHVRLRREATCKDCREEEAR